MNQRPLLLRALALPLLLAVGLSVAQAAEWKAAWAASPQDLLQLPELPGSPPPVDAQLVPVPVDRSFRQLVYPTVDGSRVRLRLSNRFGREPIELVGVSIGVARTPLAPGELDARPGSLQPVRFMGGTTLRLGQGREAWSDPVTIAVRAHQPLVVTLAAAQGTRLPTVHHQPSEAGVARDGQHLLDADWPAAHASPWNSTVVALDVERRTRTPVLVAFGDSLTAGVRASDDAAAPLTSYPDRLAERLRKAGDPIAVVNAGLAGNRLLADQIGPRGLDRFDMDVLAQTGVTHVLMLIGVNDIGFDAPKPASAPVATVEGEPLARGLRTLADRAKRHGVRVLVGTLMPFQGAAYWSIEKESRRLALNAWIRAQRDLAVVDFDAALRDPAAPARLQPRFDSGDHLHPSAVGYGAMAVQVPVSAFRNR